MDEISFLKLLKNQDNYIYGAGSTGCLLYHRLSEHGISLSGFVETEQKNRTLEGVPVFSIDTYARIKQKGQLIIAVSNCFQEEVIRNIQKRGIKDFIILPQETFGDMQREQHKKDLLRNQMMYSCTWSTEAIFGSDKKILLIAPHPDDEVISCGGVLAKYASSIDVLCMNSSGVNYGEGQPDAEHIAEERIAEFYSVMEHVGVHDAWAAKIWGIPPMMTQIRAHIREYESRFDFSRYDRILMPGIKDGHREHRYIARCILPEILKETGYKDNLLVLHYDSWAPLENVNYAEDISRVIDRKKEFIEMYETRRKGKYWEYMSGLNKYRGMAFQCEWAEAYEVESADSYFNAVMGGEGNGK